MLSNGLRGNSRLLKNAHLLRCAHYSSLRRTEEYASFLITSRALHLNVFEQPFKNTLSGYAYDVF